MIHYYLKFIYFVYIFILCQLRVQNSVTLFGLILFLCLFVCFQKLKIFVLFQYLNHTRTHVQSRIYTHTYAHTQYICIYTHNIYTYTHTHSHVRTHTIYIHIHTIYIYIYMQNWIRHSTALAHSLLRQLKS